MRIAKRLILFLGALGVLLLATAGAASARDRNHDRIPDRWEKHHHLSLKVKQANRDQDHDGLKNRAEWRAKLDPRDDDSDDDGVEDGDENAGTVKSVAGDTVTIAVFGGGEITGKVTSDTEIECDDHATATASGDDPSGEDKSDDDHGDDPAGDEDPGDDDHGEDEGDGCGPEALTVGAKVAEAELKVGSGGAVWEKVELR